jgi:hypothetical protein
MEGAPPGRILGGMALTASRSGGVGRDLCPRVGAGDGPWAGIGRPQDQAEDRGGEDRVSVDVGRMAFRRGQAFQ